MKIRIGDFESYGTKETADGMMFCKRGPALRHLFV